LVARGTVNDEQNVLDSAVKLMLDHLTVTCRTIADLQFRIQEWKTKGMLSARIKALGPVCRLRWWAHRLPTCGADDGD
jgi:hypothetical protein